MKRRMQMLIAWLAAVSVLWLLGPPPAAAQTWHGWIQCVLDIRGADYKDKEEHTWYVNGATTAIPPPGGNGSWSVRGSGNDKKGPQWVMYGGNNQAKWQVTINNNGMVSIAKRSAQLSDPEGLRWSNGLKGDWKEWDEFTSVQGPANNQTLIGQRSRMVTRLWGPRQDANYFQEDCTWSFQINSAPNPPSYIRFPELEISETVCFGPGRRPFDFAILRPNQFGERIERIRVLPSVLCP
jgi:hypothetical protein